MLAAQSIRDSEEPILLPDRDLTERSLLVVMAEKLDTVFAIFYALFNI